MVEFVAIFINYNRAEYFSCVQIRCTTKCEWDMNTTFICAFIKFCYFLYPRQVSVG